MTVDISATVRSRLVVRGIVQGVGFRPYVATLAADLGLAGSCHNDSSCVVIELEGASHSVAEFERRLRPEAPPLARITSVIATAEPPTGATRFIIEHSDEGTGVRTMVPADAATCADCLREMHDPADRRYRHPFITCTHCGPRFTITTDLPYDRPLTTMAGFPLCTECEAEYADPHNRRFHAQPISCHVCGPQLEWIGPGTASSPVDAARAALLDGQIVAVKGIGGYHLFCDATNDDAVLRLRDRKHRPHQPFAIMVQDLDQAREVVDVPAGAESTLTGIERPIVLLPRNKSGLIASSVAPALSELGVMLAYTPLHHLLLEGMPPMVATSGNASGEPLAWRDDDAILRLQSIADAFLTHDRPIAVPCDDSVVRWHGAGAVLIRRSRGFAPLPIRLEVGGDHVVLAAGADLKNTFALTRDGDAWLSGHLGDLGDLAAQLGQEAATQQMLRFHRASPEAVVADRHPGYASHAWARRLADDLGVPLILVQHHHAHLASLAAEHGRLDDDILGLVLDGTGYGCDGGIWGGELLQLKRRGTEAARLGHLAELPLPGGDHGVRNPVRVAAAALAEFGIDPRTTTVGAALTAPEARLFSGKAEWPRTSSAGRLFDVASAILGVRPRITYEAQAAVELEALAARSPVTAKLAVPAVRTADESLVLDASATLRALAVRRADADVAALARGFHAAMAVGLTELAINGALRSGCTTIGLSGGVFANTLLLELLVPRLERVGLEVLTHRIVPPGDGGISLGQAAIGCAQLATHSLEGRRN